MKSIWKRLAGKIPVSSNAFRKAVAQSRQREEKSEKRLAKCLAKLENRQAEAFAELDAIRDRVTSLLDDAFSSRRPIYEEAAADLERSIRDMEALPGGDRILVAFITDSGYALPTAVAVSSMLRHRDPSTKYDVRIVANGLSGADEALFGAFGPSVTVATVSNRFANRFAKHHHVSESALLKFDLPSLFPSEERVLYLDGDILVLGDLSGLWKTELDDAYAAVVKDFRQSLRGAGEALGHASYFNSGVMLLNAAKLRNGGIADALLEAKEHEPVSAFMDQTAFNMVFGDDVRHVSPEYNMLQTSLRKENLTGFGKAAAFYEMTESAFEKAFERPAVLHLAGKLKPWSSRYAPSYERWQDEERIFRALLRRKGTASAV